MKNNLFVPDIVTAKALISNYAGSENITINLFVVDKDTLKNVLTEISRESTPLVITPIQQVTDNKLYIGKKNNRGPLSRIDRQKYITQLAGQIFKTTREGITTGFKVTVDGKFQNIDDNIIYNSPSSAIAMYLKDKVRSPETNGWGDPKNTSGLSLDKGIARLFESVA